MSVETIYREFATRTYGKRAAKQVASALSKSVLKEKDAERVARQMRAYPTPAASGEWDWVRDAAEADLYHDRISRGWDRYGGIAVPRP
ncbi:hypothetical protein ABGB18_31120 [Nonomuraea sp. B12E4]|uniref:hypothetical protein n=1 Tax=Nonomuraea sp. B12E4 TaxID=3153564 RepID=UPI00325F67E3